MAHTTYPSSTEITLGPVICHDCHLPTMVWARGRWWDRWRVSGRNGFRYVLRRHRCTGIVR